MRRQDRTRRSLDGRQAADQQACVVLPAAVAKHDLTHGVGDLIDTAGRDLEGRCELVDSGVDDGVTPLDQASFVLVTMVFVVITMAASLVPARRATHVDPLVALRCE